MIESKTRIAVIGEAMVDKYWLGSASRLSAETPIPVVNIKGYTNFPGGAANVAENVRSLKAQAVAIFQPDLQWPRKNRLMVNDHQVARWDEFDMVKPPTDEWLDGVGSEVLGCDGVILSDYGKGFFTAQVINRLARMVGTIPTFIDTKQDPFLFSAFHEPFWFPNLAEYRAYRPSYEDLENVVLKRGAEGLQLGSQKWPAGARIVRSVNGAGDTVIASFAVRYLELAWTDDPQAQANFALEWAALAAAIACEQPYTTAVTREAIEERKRGLIPV